jgi:hypothetical protein
VILGTKDFDYMLLDEFEEGLQGMAREASIHFDSLPKASREVEAQLRSWDESLRKAAMHLEGIRDSIEGASLDQRRFEEARKGFLEKVGAVLEVIQRAVRQVEETQDAESRRIPFMRREVGRALDALGKAEVLSRRDWARDSKGASGRNQRVSTDG